MTSSAAPTPVMPNTATAVARPCAGRLGRRPATASAHEKCCGIRMSTTAASTVMSVKRPTLTTAKPLDASVAAAEQEVEGEGAEEEHPGLHGHRRHQQVHHLRHAAEHPAELEEGQEDHHGPQPHEPAHAPRAVRAPG